MAEKAVLMRHMLTYYPVPDELKHLCYYKWMSFPHDFGTYHQLVIWYDRFSLDFPEFEASESELILETKFWEFVHACERECLETPELTSEIKQYYE